MDLFLVFNELSVETEPHNPPYTIYQAREWMAGLVATLQEASKQKVKNLRTYRQFAEINLLPDYSLQQWMSDHEVDQIARQYIRTKASKLPYLEDLPDVEDRSRTFDFKLNGSVAHGCGAAYLLESIALSLACRDTWNTSQLTINIEELDETTADIKEYSTPIKHVSCADHVVSHVEWIQERLQSSVQNGADLLKKASGWFPNLVLIDDVCRQIEQMGSGTPQLRQAVKKLFELEVYCAGWKNGGFDPDQLASKATPESNTVRDNPDLRQLRMFFLPDGREAFFEWHLRITPNAWRLHFYPDPERRKIAIGYIGPKLPTARYGH